MPIMPTKARPYVAQLHLLHTAAGTAAQLPHWQPVPVPDRSFREGSLTSTLTCSPSLVLSLVTRGQPPHHTQLSAAESNSSEKRPHFPHGSPHHSRFSAFTDVVTLLVQRAPKRTHAGAESSTVLTALPCQLHHP